MLAAPDGRWLVRPASGAVRAIVALDSIGLLEATDAGCVLVIGSHGGLHGGDPRTALGVDASAAIFHDAGRGREDAGTMRLGVLAARDIAAGTVDYRTARIGDARSMWAGGVLSCTNATLASRGVHEGMTVQQAVRVLDER